MTLYIRPYVAGSPKRPEYGPGTAPPKAKEKLRRWQRSHVSSTSVNVVALVGIYRDDEMTEDKEPEAWNKGIQSLHPRLVSAGLIITNMVQC